MGLALRAYLRSLGLFDVSPAAVAYVARCFAYTANHRLWVKEWRFTSAVAIRP